MQLYDEAKLPVVIHDGFFVLHANPLAVELFRFKDLAEMLAFSVRDLIDEVSDPLAQALLARLRTDPETELELARMLFKRADDSHFLGTMHTRSVRWMSDVIGHEIAFRSTIDEIQEMP